MSLALGPFKSTATYLGVQLVGGPGASGLLQVNEPILYFAKWVEEKIGVEKIVIVHGAPITIDGFRKANAK